VRWVVVIAIVAAVLLWLGRFWLAYTAAKLLRLVVPGRRLQRRLARYARR
jgi:hypothetical protein